ncbi:hypothetical protein HBH44_244590 [Parastagonospora nodorum]|nr:hypothetical protein HBH54_245990 [Parastagonospora nodorum]KAH4122479.1 hypothetical protein HBH45_249780 [Parastagonospora nodorum]KAH4146283.1 hypothetical protein HBH44_244590 [Parastagonospora nodorum]KAH4561301.1 hypothetical protein HBH84_191710 [Parastagonospora nodorum]KAH4611642.1 hypothetical protein HBH55_242790 [Parastagonospora nodorum]
MLRRSCVRSKSLISLGQYSTVSYGPPLVDYRYIKRFLCKLFIEVVVFISLRQCSTRGCRVAGLSASSLIIREKKRRRKISKIYMPTSTSIGLKYLFALLLAANVLLPRELDCCNYYIKEASKPTLRAAD